jgi:hypothetical protein
MNILKVLLGALLAFSVLLGLALAAYKPPERMYHRPPATSSYGIKSGTYQSKAGTRPYSYSLAFVELDDDGYLVDDKQVESVMADLRSRVSLADTVVLLYVHGWNHDARDSDDNVACFEELVKATAIMQSTYKSADGKTPRGVYGIYVGWPGVVYGSEFLNKALTYLGRQSAADRVGERGALVELFTRIGQLRHEPRSQRTKFVIISHSLGGRLTYRALRPIMQKSIYEPRTSKTPFVADVAVMVNPALSADDHTVLAKLLEGQSEHDGTQPRFIIATSKSDEVLSGVYPWSQKFSSFLRGDYALGNDRRIVAIGLYEKYFTHSLELEGNFRNVSGGGRCPTLRHDELEIVKGSARAQNPAELQNYTDIRHYDDQAREIYRTRLNRIGDGSPAPIWVVTVSGKIIPNHNDIFTSPFVDFVARVVNVGLYGERALAAPGK